MGKYELSCTAVLNAFHIWIIFIIVSHNKWFRVNLGLPKNGQDSICPSDCECYIVYTSWPICYRFSNVFIITLFTVRKRVLYNFVKSHLSGLLLQVNLICIDYIDNCRKFSNVIMNEFLRSGKTDVFVIFFSLNFVFYTWDYW